MNFFIELWNFLYGYIEDMLPKILVFAFVLIFGALIVKYLNGLFYKNINKSRIKGAAGDFLLSVIKVVLYVIYLIALLALLGVPTTSMIALLSAFALAVSLALQDTFSNVASGILIITTKPFAEGDYVDIDGTSGTVETVTIFHTKLVTSDNKEIVIPNGTVTDAVVTNYSAKETRRLELIFSASYTVSVAKVKEVIHGVLDKHEEILKTPAPMVRLKEHGDSSLDYVVRIWVKQEDYWNVHFDLKEEILEAFEANDIEVPYNKLDVHIVKDGE